MARYCWKTVSTAAHCQGACCATPTTERTMQIEASSWPGHGLQTGKAIALPKPSSDQEYFADGVAEGHTDHTVTLRIAVRHRAQLELHLKGRTVDARQIGHELGVRPLAMSPLGHSRRFGDLRRMSDLHPIVLQNPVVFIGDRRP